MKAPFFPNLGLLLIRVPFGVYFAIAGVNKVRGGVGGFVGGSSGMIPPFLPESIGRAYLYAVPWAELLLGVMLVLGVFTRTAAFLAALMVFSFTVAVTGIGDGGKPFNANLIFIALLLAVTMLGPGGISVDARVPKKKPKNHA
jgi:uncharacterized membrane protein YphA (DoxX/SURF4 family)